MEVSFLELQLLVEASFLELQLLVEAYFLELQLLVEAALWRGRELCMRKVSMKLVLFAELAISLQVVAHTSQAKRIKELSQLLLLLLLLPLPQGAPWRESFKMLFVFIVYTCT